MTARPAQSESEVFIAAKLYGNGLSVREVAQQLGVSRSRALELAAQLQGAITERKAETS